ncbi:hypothetical protein K435DRAFT_710547 [Dendrothele bispora CBS 962.96]|uniref:Uncharacterized protein n=1 Tax=Dendrothele bispora (strain CBS 962.96) TaxID=1314807 RepID=A0A4S8MVA4_DENBC|nr:hypothetical protein K435DRAFT_710547 [Dendrothele bispora CBS 962.96]
MSSTSYGPVGETPEEVFLERTFMQAGYLTGLGYGFQLALWIGCMRILWDRRSSHASASRRVAVWLMVYISILCALDTIWTGASTYGLQATFIDNRNYPAPNAESPGGPIAYLNVEFSAPFNVVASIALILGNLMTDALLLWRCRVIWRQPYTRYANLVMIFPVIVFLGSLAMGVTFGIQTASPAGLFAASTASFAVPYFTISMSLNIILTLLIVVKIAYHRKNIAEALPEQRDSPRLYNLVSTMFIESAALYSIFSFLLLVTFALGHPISQIWLGLTPAVQKICSYLIIFRVARGRSWDTSTRATQASGTVSFAAAPTASSRTMNASTRSDGFAIPLRSFAEKSTVHITSETFTDRDDSLKLENKDNVV